MHYEIGQANRLGNRKNNQDRFGVTETGEGVLLALADGMGGQAHGEVAAEILIDCAHNLYRNEKRPIANPDEFLRKVIITAHERIIDFGNMQVTPSTPGTTAVLCLVQNGDATWAHVGDSRLYLYQQGVALYRTTDHSYVEQLFQSGEISRWEQDTHPQRNQITECLGCRPKEPKITVSNTVVLKPGDVILMCSDGLWGPLDDVQLGNQLENSTSLDGALNELAGKAEQLSYPQSDNISALALRFISNEGEHAVRENKVSRHLPKGQDSLEQAIAQIEEVIKEYEEEIER